jgi:predicted glycosyltransferase
MTTVLIAATHLLGSGHLVRARHLAQALAGAGFAVTLASGGVAQAGPAAAAYRFVQLPPVRVAGVDFRTLLDETGAPIGEERRARRIAMLEELVRSQPPDIVVTEHFPFGRRQLAAEFLALIAAARAAQPRALVLSSVRDVLVTPKPERVAEAHRRLETLFDGVLVHGDRAFLPLEASWPVTAGLAEKLRYTGYLAAPARRCEALSGEALPGRQGSTPPGSLRAARNDGDGDILVSGGGSGAALPLFAICLAAARLMPERRWHLLVGRGTAADAFERLAASAPRNARVEWARPDFPALLAHCALSISQAGYNTVLDLVAAGRPAIVVPFDEGAETEQTIRALAMEKAGLARSLRLGGEAAPTAAALAKACEEAIAAGPPGRPVRLDRDGAAGSVAAIRSFLAGRGTSSAGRSREPSS